MLRMSKITRFPEVTRFLEAAKMSKITRFPEMTGNIGIIRVQVLGSDRNPRQLGSGRIWAGIRFWSKTVVLETQKWVSFGSILGRKLISFGSVFGSKNVDLAVILFDEGWSDLGRFWWCFGQILGSEIIKKFEGFGRFWRKPRTFGHFGQISRHTKVWILMKTVDFWMTVVGGYLTILGGIWWKTCEWSFTRLNLWEQWEQIWTCNFEIRNFIFFG